MIQCPKLRKILECNCDYCKYRKAVEHAGGPERMHQQTASKLANQRLRNSLDRLWQQAHENRLKREEYEKTIRLLSLFDKR